jgi:hypothetical protein
VEEHVEFAGDLARVDEFLEEFSCALGAAVVD